MNERRYEIVLCPREGDPLTLEGLAARADLHPGVVERFVACGLVEPVEWVGPLLLFDPATVPRLQMIMRLRRDTGVNLAGVEVILDLLDRLRSLDLENRWLRAQL